MYNRQNPFRGGSKRGDNGKTGRVRRPNSNSKQIYQHKLEEALKKLDQIQELEVKVNMLERERNEQKELVAKMKAEQETKAAEELAEKLQSEADAKVADLFKKMFAEEEAKKEAAKNEETQENEELSEQTDDTVQQKKPWYSWFF